MIRLLLLSTALLLPACGDDDGTDAPVTSSRAYRGHANDADMNAFVNAYHGTVGTRLDDCQTCHRGGTFTEEDEPITKNACDFCHLIDHPADPGFLEPQPTTFEETLNEYGAAYLAAGRNVDALREISGDDSDGDGFDNGAEVDALKYPGDPASMPGQPAAPVRTLTMQDIQALPVTSEFLLSNANRQQFDSYQTYAGPTVQALLEAAGVDLSNPDIQGITVIAPDGYLKDVPVSDLTAPFPAGLYYGGLDTATLGPDCGFVTYPDVLPDGLTEGGEIPGDPWVLLATERDGLPLDPSELDPVTGKINGEGPLRLIVPQRTPGRPDRGAQFSPTTCGDADDYDPERDHNAGAMVRGVIGIRVNPLPAGFEDFDAHNGGWAYVDAASVIVYGTGIEE